MRTSISGRTAGARRGRGERGAASVVMAGVLAVVLAVGVAALVVGGYVVAVHRARSAADLSALSGAGAYARGGDACAAARRTAADNHATVTHCDQVGDQLDFVVSVEIHVAVGRSLPGSPGFVSAVAYAGAESS